MQITKIKFLFLHGNLLMFGSMDTLLYTDEDLRDHREHNDRIGRVIVASELRKAKKIWRAVTADHIFILEGI